MLTAQAERVFEGGRVTPSHGSPGCTLWQWPASASEWVATRPAITRSRARVSLSGSPCVTTKVIEFLPSQRHLSGPWLGDRR